MGYLLGVYGWCAGARGALLAYRIYDRILFADSKVLQEFKWRTMS